jgi:Uma2 family endonuclease
MGAQPLHQMSEQEYLLFEEQSEQRHEFYQGEVFAMAGGSITHARIMANALGEIRQRLKGKTCEVFGSDLRVQIEVSGLYTYPDLSIVCGDIRRYKGRMDTITNPVALIEVLSPAAAEYDRGQKFEFYREIPSLQEYILISSSRIRIEQFTRTATGQWLLTDYKSRDEVLYIESIAEDIRLEELYSRVSFTES